MPQDRGKASDHIDDRPIVVEGLGGNTGTIFPQDPATHPKRHGERYSLDWDRRSPRTDEVQRSSLFPPPAVFRGEQTPRGPDHRKNNTSLASPARRHVPATRHALAAR